MEPVIILAGGFGTRLSSVLNGLPKPMADINGTPFLELLIKKVDKDNIKKVAGVTEVDLKLVWDPPWNKDKMSEAAKLELNL